MSVISRGAVLCLSLVLAYATTLPAVVGEGASTTLRAPKTESEWQACEILRSATEMLLYAKTHALSDDGLAVGFASGNSDSPVVLGVRVAKESSLVTAPLSVLDFAAAPEPYVPLLAKQLKLLGLSASGKQRSDGPAFLDRLTDIRTSVLSGENARISEWLEREPLNPDAHEEAAFLITALGLKEHAGYFFDDRPAALQAAAHLAVALSLRNGGSDGLAGRFAREALRAIDGDEAGVRSAMRGVRKLAKLSAGEKAWANALELYSTFDWTILEKPTTASLLERFMYCRALQARIGTDAAVEFLRKRNTEPIADWGRLLFDGSGSVGISNAFAGVALPQQLSELADLAKMERGLTVSNGADIRKVLSTPTTRGVESVDGHVRLRPISWSLWSRFFERHLMATGLVMHARLARKLRLPDEAKKVRLAVEQLLAGCRLEPLLRAELAEQKAEEERPVSGQSVWKREPEIMKATASYIRSHPEEITAPVWHSVSLGAPSDAELAGVPYTRWFGLEEGSLDGLQSFFSTFNIKFLNDHEFEKLKARRAYDRDVLLEYSTRHYNRKPTLAQFDELYGALVASDIQVMKWRAEYLLDDMTQYRAQYERIANIDPKQWDTLAQELVGRNLEAEAAAAYRKMVDEVQDPVFISNEVDWLVDYDLENHNLEEAAKLARAAGDAYSATGLEILARYFEARGDLDSAETTYKKIDKRYQSPQFLHAFYMRRHLLDPKSYAAQAADAEAKEFPHGLEQVKLSDFNEPPADGAEIITGSSLATRVGMSVGSVVGGLDGYRVRSYEQYCVIRDLTHAPDMRIIVWDGKTWREVQGRFRTRRFGARFRTLPKKTCPTRPLSIWS